MKLFLLALLILISGILYLKKSAIRAKPFSVCFSPPELSAIPADVKKRANRYSRKIAAALKAKRSPLKAWWVEAILMHESGADAFAISPTGCAGAFAISLAAGVWADNQDLQACCLPKPGISLYDSCREETTTGFRCEKDKDPRFHFGLALEKAIGILESHYWALRETKLNDRQKLIALGTAYNAGRAVYQNYPDSLMLPEPVLQSLRFQSVKGYQHWPAEDLARKVVEIADYAQWMDWLTDLFEGSSAKQNYETKPAYLCVNNQLHRAKRTATLPPGMQPLPTVRLAYGKYSPTQIWFKP